MEEKSAQRQRIELTAESTNPEQVGRGFGERAHVDEVEEEHVAQEAGPVAARARLEAALELAEIRLPRPVDARERLTLPDLPRPLAAQVHADRRVQAAHDAVEDALLVARACAAHDTTAYTVHTCPHSMLSTAISATWTRRTVNHETACTYPVSTTQLHHTNKHINHPTI